MTGSHADEVVRLFDVKAPGWPAKYAPDGPLAARLARLSAAVSRYARTGDRVLDIGCGTGELARALAAGGLRVTGCDVSPQMLLRAARHQAAQDATGQPGAGPERSGQPGPEWVRLEPHWRRLPFASAAFDVVVLSSVLEYVTDPAGVLRECARVLCPGGVVLCTVPDLRHPVRWAEWGAGPLARMTPEPPAIDHRTRSQGYRAYLRASRQRHRARWWLAVSAAAGLSPLPDPAGRAVTPLRLLAFRAGEG